MVLGAVAVAACGAAACDPAAGSSPIVSGLSGAASFSVLANAAVTCTNGTSDASMGTFLAPNTGSVTLTGCPIGGAVHVGDGAAKLAFNDFLVTYAAMAPKQGDVCTALSGTLDGRILAPGVYCFDAAATLTGVLTLNGPPSGIWIFKIGVLGTGALTGTNFTVNMNGGGQACNVMWWVAGAATLTTSNFKGDILAGAAITTTGGTLNGNAWSKADATITGTAVTSCGGAAGKGGTGDDDDKKKKDHDEGDEDDQGHDHDKDHHDRDHRDEDHSRQDD